METKKCFVKGDVWQCAGGAQAEVITVDPVTGGAQVRQTSLDLNNWRVDVYGRKVHRVDTAGGACPADLVRLVSRADGFPVVGTTTPKAPVTMTESTDTKLSNPKEAIGDKKVPMWLCSAIAKAHWAAGQFAGLMKYGAWNWRVAGVRTSTYLSAMARHIDRYANGERLDPVDGTHHLGNVMACAAILLEAEYLGKLNDDRSPRADLGDAFAEVEAIMARLKVQYADKNPHHHTINDEAPL